MARLVSKLSSSWLGAWFGEARGLFRLNSGIRPARTMFETRYQGRCHQVLFGGGDGFMGTQTHLPPKLSFSSNFGHFILKILEDVKFAYVSRKKILKYHKFWGVPSPPSPAFDAHARYLAQLCSKLVSEAWYGDRFGV